jgi:signal transduction histidine kinase
MVLAEPMTGSPAAADPSQGRVLVVDDEEAVMLTIQGILELDGYEVIATASGEAALELIGTQYFDVVLTDLRLEDGMDGLDLVRELRRQSLDAVAIMLTGYASLDSAVKALREGAYDYLYKPCDVLELRTTVSRGLEKSRLAAQLRARVAELETANETIRSLNLELEGRVERATAELREQITLRDEFMATVSHDLKSPLTFIKGMANLRRRRASQTSDTVQLVDALDQIESTAGRMAQQLDELVDASRLESGRTLDLRRDATDLVALARKAVAEHQQTTDRHVLQVSTDLSELVGHWDVMRLGRVLDNLLDNAVKYSPRGGAVLVSIGVDGTALQPMAVLSVVDRGEGIPSTDLPHIFERFHRGRNVGRIPGTGIGLAGVRRIVELHSGTISALSEVGQGTTFTVRLPLTVETS